MFGWGRFGGRRGAWRVSIRLEWRSGGILGCIETGGGDVSELLYDLVEDRY